MGVFGRVTIRLLVTSSILKKENIMWNVRILDAALVSDGKLHRGSGVV